MALLLPREFFFMSLFYGPRLTFQHFLFLLIPSRPSLPLPPLPPPPPPPLLPPLPSPCNSNQQDQSPCPQFVPIFQLHYLVLLRLPLRPHLPPSLPVELCLPQRSKPNDNSSVKSSQIQPITSIMNWVSDTAQVLIEVRDIILSRVNKFFLIRLFDVKVQR